MQDLILCRVQSKYHLFFRVTLTSATLTSLGEYNDHIAQASSQ